MSAVVFCRIAWAIARKELRQIVRDRITAALLLGVPLAQILLFGHAIDLAPRHWPTAWVAPPRVDARLIDAETAVDAAGWLRVTHHTESLDEAQAWMQRGEVRFIVVLPTPARAASSADGPPRVRVLADLSDPFAAAALNALQREAQPPADSDAARPLDLQFEALYAARRGAGEYLVPALAGVILTLTLTLLAALSIVREVERGTWPGLLTSPAGAAAIVTGKLMTYLVLGAALFAVLTGVARLQFGTAWGGWALWVAALLFMLANLGLGLVISLLARTQMQAMQMGVFFYLPSILLSGFMFPFHAMPAWARAIGEALPLTHFLRCLRADLIRGADPATVLSLAQPIAGFAALALAAALWRARRKILAS